jgi:hypothetical protein
MAPVLQDKGLEALRRSEEVMAAWLRMLAAIGLVLLPGGFVFLFGYVLGRALWNGWRRASVQANGGPVHLREVMHTLHFRELVNEARHSL